MPRRPPVSWYLKSVERNNVFSLIGRATRCAVLATWLALGLGGCSDSDGTVYIGRPDGPLRLSLETKPLDGARRYQLTTRLVNTTDASPVTGLQVLHERVVHNFIVARDFSSFEHIHHEDFAPLTPDDLAQARLTFPYTFPTDGHYRVVSEFTLNDRSHVRHYDLEIGAAASLPTVKPDLRRQIEFGDYTATLTTTPEAPVAGGETELLIRLDRGGEPVTDLELLLGSEVHLASWRIDGHNFGHAHSYTAHMAEMMDKMHDRRLPPAERARRMTAMMVAMNRMTPELEFPGPEVPLRHVFPEPGTYVLFFHMAPGGEPHYFRFMLETRSPTS